MMKRNRNIDDRDDPEARNVQTRRYACTSRALLPLAIRCTVSYREEGEIAGQSPMPTAPKSTAPDAAQIYQRMLPWVLITEIYWVSYKLLERRFYHMGVSASQARVLAVLHFSDAP